MRCLELVMRKAFTAVWKVEFKKKFVTPKPTMRGLLGLSKGSKSVVRKIAVAWP